MIVSANPPRDWNTSSNFGSVDMSDSSYANPGPHHSRTNIQRHSKPPSIEPSMSHANSLPPSTQHHLPTNFPVPPLHYSASPPPHAHGGAYGQYPMSPRPTPMGAMHSPSSYGFSHSYHHPIVPESIIIPQKLHTHYQSLSQPPHAYQYQQHPHEDNSHSSFSATGPASMYSTHQRNVTSPYPTPPIAQNSPLSPSNLGPGAFHSLQYSSPVSTPHYTYSPPFPGTSPYQSQFPPPQFGQRYTTNVDGEPQGDWYYVPRHSSVVPSQKYDAGSFYSGHYSTGYPQIRPELTGAYNATSFSSTSSSTPYPTLAIGQFSQHSETLTSGILRGSMGHTASLSSGSEHFPSDKPIARQPYHPNPPPHRSEWVMWAGNIPSDATHDEIYRFFSHISEKASEHIRAVSVFLISRSNCAFVNFESEGCLLKAISRFNGVSLRPDDPRCARLVCRVRHKDDDLKAGVGGQRGTGMHTRWVKEQKQKAQEKDQSDLSASDDYSTSPSSIPEELANAISNFSLSSDDSGLVPKLHAKRSSTPDSYSSSNSNFLERYFPKRYFILKSLTEHDLDISVQTGLWATQKHNEGILDQSYRTSKDVYLIFGANKSGEFYGYARMAGPVRRGEQNISWAPPHSNESPTSGQSCPIFFSPGDHRLVDTSPLSLDGFHTKTASDPHLGQKSPTQKLPQSAPGMLGVKYDRLTMKTPEMKYSLDQHQKQFKAKELLRVQNDDFELDPSAPVRAMRSTGGKPRGTSLHSLEKVEERAEEPDEVAIKVQEPSFSHDHEEGEDSWGDCFAVEWISTEKLPFNRTRQIRNPWNHDREVKVSRDGTELEPTVGQKLLDEWHRLSESQEQQHQQHSSTLARGVEAGGQGGSKPVASSSKRLASRSTTVEHRSA